MTLVAESRRRTESRPDPLTDVWTMADLLRHLGHVPADRVIMRPPPGMATEEDLLRIDARDDRICELIDGVLVERPSGILMALISVQLTRHFFDYFDAFEPHCRGLMAGSRGAMRLPCGNVRSPNISVVLLYQFPDRVIPREPIPDIHPDLSVDILAESNTQGEMLMKRRQFFEAGTRLVWEIEPEGRVARAYSTPEEFTDVDKHGVLDGGDVLPGLQISLADVFERALHPFMRKES